MGRKYVFSPDPRDIYFVTSTVVRWIDLFTRDVYRQILIDSLAYCQDVKGLDIYAWVIMTNHIAYDRGLPWRVDDGRYHAGF